MVTSVPGRGIAAYAERDRGGLFGHRLGLAEIEQLVLEEDHRVVVADRGDQQALGVVGRGGRDHHEARHVGEPGLQALAVLRRKADAAALAL
jgi:hypothetical protein